MTEETLKLFSRMSNDGDGIELLKFIKDLSYNNYEEWKRQGTDVLRGKAIAFDELIMLFENSADRLNTQSKKESLEWL
jgi:hypothetical protein